MPSIVPPSRPRSMGVPTATRDSFSRLTSRSESPSAISCNKPSTSFPWILYHILERQFSSELPLRIMFSFNAGEQLPTLKQAHEWWQYDPKGKLIIEFLSSLPQINPSNADLALSKAKKEQIRKSNWGKCDDLDSELCDIDRFMDMHHDLLFDIDFADDIDKARKNSGFPLTLIRQMCLKTVFRADYREADFNQALTALDYLRDLECTRRTALRDAAVQLGITSETWKEVLSEDKEAYTWVETVQKQELEIESHYANIFIDLRIWTMVHELQSEPFYKPNVLAMLNTLFPPSMKDLPNDRIDINALKKYRATLYQYILAVEAKGTSVIKEFVQQLLKPEAKHSWTSARRHLEQYIELADIMIRQANTVKGNDRDSLRHSRTVSGANSAFSERPSTASSANTTWSGQQSPVFPTSSGNSKQGILSRPRLSNPADITRTIQSQPSSPTLFPPPLQPSTSNSGRNAPKNTQSPSTPAPTFSERRPGASRPPAKPVPPLPRSKTDLYSDPRPQPPYKPRNPEAPPRPPRSPPSSPRYKSHSVPSTHHSQVALPAHIQTIPNSPLSSSFAPEELLGSAKLGKARTRPNTPTLKDLRSDNGDFLTRPYSAYGETLSLEPAMKKKSSMTNIFGLRRGSDASTIKAKDSSISLRSTNPSKPTDPFPQYSEPESDLLMGKLKKKKSKPSLRGDQSRRPSIDMKRTTTWPEGVFNLSPNKLTLSKSRTSEGSSFDDEPPTAPLKKSKGWKSSLGRARGALRGRNKSSPKKVEFEPAEYNTLAEPYVMSRPDPAFHPPSAPSSPTAAMFATELDLPDRESLRRTKSFGQSKSTIKTLRTKANPPPVPKVTLPTTDYCGLPLDHPGTSSLADSLPSSYLIHNTPLPLSEDYDVIRAREYTRKSLIAKAYAEKNELDFKFEKPRTAPVPQMSKRGKEFAKEVAWVPFEMPRATPKTPQKKYAPVDVSRFSK